MTNQNNTAAADLYNFADTTGVPAEVAADVNRERRSGLDEALYDAVVSVVNGAPKALTIKQVVFVLYKLVAAEKLDKVPAETTVRAYLNRARENGDIGKPSRQSYWTAESNVEDAAQEEVEGETAPENDGSEDAPEDDLNDPLADA